jgi:hypothetical protein
MKKILNIFGAALALLYILNPTLGVFELLPDNMPILGNIDEAAAGVLLVRCLRNLGWLPALLGGERKDTPR